MPRHDTPRNRWSQVHDRESVAVLVPWRAGDSQREANLEHVLASLRATTPWPVTVAELSPDEPWSKGRALEPAVAATGAEVLVLHDADVIVPGLTTTVSQVQSGRAGWAVPHTTVCRLTEEATAAVLSGGPLRGPFERRYRGVEAGGAVVIRRELYTEAPFDSRFEGWGHEDLAAAVAWRLLGGTPWRSTEPLWHLYHPPQPKITAAIGSRRSKLLLDRYRACRDAGTLRELIAESTMTGVA